MKPELYTSKFEGIRSDAIAEEIKKEGYFTFPGALTEECIDRLLSEINFDEILVNVNDVGVVYTGNQRFFTHCLAKSELAYQLMTSRKVLEICQSYFTDCYKLINHRICQTYQTMHMPWHTDNNYQVGSHLSGKHTMPGLLFLFYLSDVTDKGGFQYVKNSHQWSHRYDHEIYFNDDWIEKHYRSEIVTLRVPKGSLILCDTHGIHRAEPFQDRHKIRTTLLFQVDQVGSRLTGHGEKNLINTEYLHCLDQELMNYLGFGSRSVYPAFPTTSIQTLRSQDFLTIQQKLLSSVMGLLIKNTAKAFLPPELRIRMKRLFWRFRNQKSQR